ncbi:hypothetical protein KF728_10480 [Candidatus Obscuribacterales bacterium]|nr:hypothetical protein [Candidatus Obscuribacterales bacterium]MBX3150563.1 hypothetical protein [Candidatus Obscuribacterales bacterium]
MLDVEALPDGRLHLCDYGTGQEEQDRHRHKNFAVHPLNHIDGFRNLLIEHVRISDRRGGAFVGNVNQNSGSISAVHYVIETGIPGIFGS